LKYCLRFTGFTDFFRDWTIYVARIGFRRRPRVETDRARRVGIGCRSIGMQNRCGGIRFDRIRFDKISLYNIRFDNIRLGGPILRFARMSGQMLGGRCVTIIIRVCSWSVSGGGCLSRGTVRTGHGGMI
jgi:hypothetical protein